MTQDLAYLPQYFKTQENLNLFFVINSPNGEFQGEKCINVILQLLISSSINEINDYVSTAIFTGQIELPVSDFT